MARGSVRRRETEEAFCIGLTKKENNKRDNTQWEYKAEAGDLCIVELNAFPGRLMNTDSANPEKCRSAYCTYCSNRRLPILICASQQCVFRHFLSRRQSWRQKPS